MSENKIRKKYKKSRYSLETLINFSIEKKFKLLKEYTDDNIHIECIIEGTCATEECENNFSKNYKRLMTISGPYCKFCQNGRTIFDKNTLNNYVKKNNIELLKDYSDINICRDTEIEGKCNNEICNNNFKKNFRYLIEEGGPYCDDCTEISRLKKSEETGMKKFGSKYYAMSEEGKNKIKNTVINKYGVDSVLKVPEIRNKIKKTILEKYNVEYILQSQEFKDKFINTSLINYGVKYPSQNNDVKEKIKETCLKIYGTSNPLQNKEIRDKIEKTNIERYGTKFPAQNKIIKEKMMDKMSKNAYKKKIYTTKTGKEYSCQGYEPYALKILFENPDLNENNVIMGVKNVPKINYQDKDGIEHVHYPDIFINNQNKIIEIKSTWTLEKKSDSVFIKQKSAKNLGYLYEIWVINDKGKIIEKYE
jgi:hypothetical protein